MYKDLRVLELNADFIPLNLVPLSVISVQVAFKKIVEGTAVPVKFYENRYIHTPTTRYQIPSVIILREYKHLKKYAKWSKSNIKLRDEYRCQYCGKRFSEKSLTIDHVIPRKDGGKHSWTNSVTACKPCNARKSHHREMKPIRKPYQPNYYELAKKMMKHKKVDTTEWKDYL